MGELAAVVLLSVSGGILWLVASSRSSGGGRDGDGGGGLFHGRAPVVIPIPVRVDDPSRRGR